MKKTENGIWIITVMLLSFLVPIFLIDKPYTDDYARTIKGYFNWSNDGRPLADLVIYVINMGGSLSDISPFSYLLTIAISIFSSFLIYKYVVRQNTVASAVSSSLIFLSPFYIHNMLYKYDCITMSLSILFCCIPFAMKNKEGIKIKSAFSFLMILFSLSLYQASAPLYFGLILIELTRIEKFESGKNLKLTICRCISGLLAIVVYKFIVAKIFVTGDYGTDRSKLLPFSLDGLKQLIANISDYFYFIFHSISIPWLIITSITLSLCALSLIITIKQSQKKLELSFLLMFTISCITASSLMFFFTKNPVFYPRIMIGYNSFIAMIFCILCMELSSRYKIVINSLLIAMCCIYFSQHSKVLNFIKSNYNNEKQMAFMMKIDMLSISPESILYIHGYPPLTIDSKKIKDNVPYVTDIYHPDLGWNTTRLFTDIETPFLKSEKGSYYGSRDEVCGKVVKKWNGIYTITLKNGKYHAVFRNEICN